MKYIKSFNEEFSILYFEISETDYFKKVGLNSTTYFLDFKDDENQKDLELIKSYLTKVEIQKDLTVHGSINKTISNPSHYSIPFFNIHKLNDEWYYVSICIIETEKTETQIIETPHWSYYKCDTIEGLIQLLKKYS